jgi:membrane protein
VSDEKPVQQQDNGMTDLWTLGGLSIPEVLKRTALETWRDAVFGQAGRMAFYHFLGIFPALFVFLTLASHSNSIAGQIKHAVDTVGHQFLPPQVSSLLIASISELNSHSVAGWKLISAIVSALWASLNATWAVVYGLNKAYEVDEERGWWHLGRTIVLLTLFLAALFWIGLALFFAATWAEVRVAPDSALLSRDLLRAAQWIIVLALLLLGLAVVYRFAPNLRDREWRWSTPGALCAIVLWVACSFGVRIYFAHFDTKSEIYGRLNSVVMLLLWLYVTNAAILIGGEMNSEIEKAAEAEGDGKSRSGT